MSEPTITYLLSGIPVSKFRQEVELLLEKLRSDSGLQAEAIAAGMDPATLDELDRRAISVEDKGAYLDPITVAIIVKILIPVGGKVALDLWTNVLLPRVKQRLGSEAIKEDPNSKK
jgi:hypothetical protein